MPGRKTSVYLSEELSAAVELSGASLPDLIRRGLERADRFTELARDHRDLLWLIDETASGDQRVRIHGQIHRDSRCTKTIVPHVLTVDCWPQPDAGNEP